MADKVSITVKPGQFKGVIDRPLTRIRSRRQNIEQTGGMVLIEKTRPDVPMDTHRLRSSANVRLGRTDKGTMVQYDPVDPQTGEHYARTQETNLTYHHPHGKALFLSDRVRWERENIVNVMKNEVYKVLRES